MLIIVDNVKYDTIGRHYFHRKEDGSWVRSGLNGIAKILGVNPEVIKESIADARNTQEQEEDIKRKYHSVLEGIRYLSIRQTLYPNWDRHKAKQDLCTMTSKAFYLGMKCLGLQEKEVSEAIKHYTDLGIRYGNEKLLLRVPTERHKV